MSTQKVKSLWPLPGGFRNYHVTLRKILERVKVNSPTLDELVSWLRSEYKLSGDRAPYGYVRVLTDSLVFAQDVGGRLKLSPVAEEYLKTGDNGLVFQSLVDRVLGVAEVILILADGRHLSLSDIHKELVRMCGVDWRGGNQTMFRVYWLLSLGYISKDNRGFFLTEKGMDACKGLPRPQPPTYEAEKPQGTIQELQRALQEKEQTILELQRALQERENRIRELEAKITPSPIEGIIQKLENTSGLTPEDFEWTLKRAFDELGFDASWNGELRNGVPQQTAPPGKPDVEVRAPLAGDPYCMVVEATKVEEERYQVTEVHGAVDHSRGLPSLPYRTCYRLVVAPRFKKGAIEACNTMDPQYPVMLLTSQDFLEILKFHSEVGGITQEELKHLFDELNGKGEIRREQIEKWEETIKEQRKKLSLALTVYDILYSDKEFMWPREIWRELKKQRSLQGLPCESLQDVHDVLKILDTIGALIVKPDPDVEKYNYKAGLTPEGFRLRIRKLEETVRLQESKQPHRTDKISSWMQS